MGIHQIIAILAIKQNLENLISKQIVVYAKINILMMNTLNCASLAIIHGQ